MRIGLFTNNYRPLLNGLAISVETFAQAFRRAGHDVTIVAPRYPGVSSREKDVIRVPGVRAPTHHAYVLPIASWPSIAHTVAALSLDVFHAQHPLLLGRAAAKWARCATKPLVFTYHTHYERYAHYVPGPSRLLARLAIRQATAFANCANLVVVPAPALIRVLRARGVRTRIAVAPTGVSLPSHGKSHRAACRRALGLEGSPLCLSVGRLAKEKNQTFLLTAFVRIIRELPSARLILVGEGDDRSRLERLARGMGIRDHLRFVGAVSREDVGEYYRAADLFLFPSTSETQGIVVLEALSAGLPVVAVTSDAAQDLLGDGQGGMLASELPEQFTRSVVELWKSPERREAMGEGGRHIAAQYAPDACAVRLLGLYAETMQSFEAVPTGAVPEPTEART